MRKQGTGLTLVELMVAVGLGSILIGVITFVWMQSNKIFTSTLNRMEAYQRLRIVLDVMERDLANTNRTVDMEFFDDVNKSGHFDDGTTDQLLPAGAPGYRAPSDPEDPLKIASKPEFEDADAWNAASGNINNHPFFHAPLVFSPSPYEITQDDYLSTRSYWRDEIYVRTFAMADGINRPAMVHYRLVPQADGRMALRRRMWFLNELGQMVAAPAPNATDRFAILSTGMCDLKVGFYFKENASSTVGSSQPNGWWYHVGLHPSDSNAQHRQLETDDTKAGYVSALVGSPLPAQSGPTVPPLSAQHVNRNQFASTGNAWNAVTFFYKGVMRVSLVEGKVLLNPIASLTADWNDSATVLDFDFPGVRPGDKVFLSKATDDDNDFWGSGRPASSVSGPNPFPDQLFTVESILSNWNTNYVAIKVEEPMSFPRLIRRWLKVESPVQYLPFDAGRPAGTRTVEGSFNAEYRVGFLPAAFRVRMSMDDKYNKKVLPMERVIRLIQQ